MTSSLSHIKSLKPDTFRIHSIFKVIELAICLQVTKPNRKAKRPFFFLFFTFKKHNEFVILFVAVTIYEYLVADDSGCIILNTTSGFSFKKKHSILRN